MIDKMDLLDRASSDKRLSGGAFRVLARIVLHHWNAERQDCWPGDDCLAEALGTTARYVRSHLKVLEAEGYLRRTFSKAERRRYIELLNPDQQDSVAAENQPSLDQNSPTMDENDPPVPVQNQPRAAAENQPQNPVIESRKGKGRAGADRKRTKRPLPDHWTPKPEAIARVEEKAREAGLTANGAGVAEKFKTLSVAKDWRYVNWDAAFRNFADNEIDYALRDGRKHIGGGVPQVASGALAGVDPDERWRAKVAAFQRDGTWDKIDGRPPDHQACRAPIHVLRQFGYGSAAA